MSIITAPAGWGWKPGTIITAIEPEDLPELPLLEKLPPERRNGAIVVMLRQNPELLARARPRDLVKRYGMPASSAQTAITKARQVA